MRNEKREVRHEMVASGLIVGAVALAACGGPSAGGGWSTEREVLPSGTVQVTHRGPGEPTPTWTLTEELRVGALEGGQPASFGALKGLVVFADGGFAVLETQAQEIRVFGQDGSHQATFGRRGEGPGEFVDANGLMVDPHGQIWATDPRTGRVSVFERETGLVETLRFMSRGYGWIWRGTMLDDGRVLLPSTSRGETRRRIMVIYDSTMTVVDSVFLDAEGPELSNDPNDDEGAFVRESGAGFSMMSVPFFPHPIHKTGSSGFQIVASGWEAGYRLARFVPGGDTTLVIRMTRSPVLVSEAERDRAIADVVEFLGGEQLDLGRIPTTKPPVNNVLTSVEGNFWVNVPAATGGSMFDVFSPEGDYLGTVDPRGVEVQDLEDEPEEANFSGQSFEHVENDTFWAVVTDALGVPWVIRARIES